MVRDLVQRLVQPLGHFSAPGYLPRSSAQIDPKGANDVYIFI